MNRIDRPKGALIDVSIIRALCNTCTVQFRGYASTMGGTHSRRCVSCNKFISALSPVITVEKREIIAKTGEWRAWRESKYICLPCWRTASGYHE